MGGGPQGKKAGAKKENVRVSDAEECLAVWALVIIWRTVVLWWWWWRRGAGRRGFKCSYFILLLLATEEEEERVDLPLVVWSTCRHC